MSQLRQKMTFTPGRQADLPRRGGRLFADQRVRLMHLARSPAPKKLQDQNVLTSPSIRWNRRSISAIRRAEYTLSIAAIE